MIFSKRIWGWWIVLLSGRLFKVKILFFRKHQSCSMQRHLKRKEIWLVLFGNGVMRKVINGKEIDTHMISGDYNQVEFHQWHSFLGLSRTLVLEVQIGECREEDIERI